MNLSKFIGIPYKHLGRDFTGFDCYGLVWLAYKEILNIELPDYTDLLYRQDWYKHKDNHILNNVSWVKKVEYPFNKFDGILIYNGSNEIVNHIALYIGDNRILHIFEGVTSRIDRFDGYWKSKTHSGMRFLND